MRQLTLSFLLSRKCFRYYRHKLIVRPRVRPHVAISSGFARLSKRDRQRRGASVFVGFAQQCPDQRGMCENLPLDERKREKVKSHESFEGSLIPGPLSNLIQFPGLFLSHRWGTDVRAIYPLDWPPLYQRPLFFSLFYLASEFVIHDVFIHNFPTCKNTIIKMHNVGNRTNKPFARESAISKQMNTLESFKQKIFNYFVMWLSEYFLSCLRLIDEEVPVTLSLSLMATSNIYDEKNQAILTKSCTSLKYYITKIFGYLRTHYNRK